MSYFEFYNLVIVLFVGVLFIGTGRFFELHRQVLNSEYDFEEEDAVNRRLTWVKINTTVVTLMVAASIIHFFY